MQRCNEPAIWVSAKNGYRTCRDHIEPNGHWFYIPEELREPETRCDKPIEPEKHFWETVVNIRPDIYGYDHEFQTYPHPLPPS